MHDGGALAQVEGAFTVVEGLLGYAVEWWTDGVEFSQVLCAVEGSR